VVTNCSANALDMMEKMLAINPAKRWTCQELLSHPYFTEDDKKNVDDS
jgi:serine/threonine protein kinase